MNRKRYLTSTSPTRKKRRPLSPRAARAISAYITLMLVGIIVVGVVGIVIGWHTRAQERPVHGWTTTTGTVVGVRNEAVRDGYVYGPIVSFVDSDGNPHRFTAPTNDDEPTVGEQATISYDPANPAHAHDLSDSGTNWLGPFVVGIFITSFGTPMFGFLTWIRIHQRRRNRLNQPVRPASP